jgi:S-(hydroxymethyl)glutathione dehydrogenase/alcohol dehydrogenase
LVDAYLTGKIMVDEFVTGQLPLNEINEAFNLMHAGKRYFEIFHHDKMI